MSLYGTVPFLDNTAKRGHKMPKTSNDTALHIGRINVVILVEFGLFPFFKQDSLGDVAYAAFQNEIRRGRDRMRPNED